MLGQVPKYLGFVGETRHSVRGMIQTSEAAVAVSVTAVSEGCIPSFPPSQIPLSAGGSP